MKITKERQAILAEYLTLTQGSEERIAFGEEHGINAQERFFYERDYQIKTRTRARTRKARLKTLHTQQGRCALCDTDIGDSRCCLDKTGKVVCGRCNQFLTLWRKYQADGITEEAIIEFNQ